LTHTNEVQVGEGGKIIAGWTATLVLSTKPIQV